MTIAGKPIEEGSIAFIPADGNNGPTAGGTTKNGEYSIPARYRSNSPLKCTITATMGELNFDLEAH